MKIRHLAVLILFIFSWNPTVLAQNVSSNAVLSPSSMKDDLQFLRSALNEVHPSLYRYVTKDSLEKIFDECLLKIGKPLTKREYALIVQYYLAIISSGHTHVTPAYTNVNPGFSTYFPFLIALREEKVYLANSLNVSDSRLSGCEVLSVMDVPIASILANVRRHVPGEGLTTSYKDYKLQKTLTFINLLNELYGSRKSYSLSLRDSSGTINRLEIEAIDRRTLLTSITTIVPRNYSVPEEMREVSYPDDMPSTAIYTVRSFNYRDYDIYREFDRTTFRDFKKRRIKNLIIDLRGNSGGAYFSAIDILRYLIPNEFLINRDDFALTSRPSFENDIVNKSELLAAPFERRRGGGFTIRNMASAPIKPFSDLVFSGNVILLTDGGTFSVASMFAACLRANRKVAIVGEMSGGTKTGLDSGPFRRLSYLIRRLRLFSHIFILR